MVLEVTEQFPFLRYYMGSLQKPNTGTQMPHLYIVTRIKSLTRGILAELTLS